jgi:hypothetical protein
MRRERSIVLGSACWLALGCTPSSDLDAHARGAGAAAAASGSEPLPTDAALELPGGVEGLSPEATGQPGGSAGAEQGPAPVGLDDPVTAVVGGSADAGASPSVDPPGPADAAAPPQGEPTEPPVLVTAPPLPDDLVNAPVSGEIVFSDEAEWEVDGVFEPTFEVHTPTASYWVVKPLGTIVSIEDREDAAEQWVAFSSGFRPLRGVPSFPTPPATRVSTVRDAASQTPTHLRLTSESEDGLWQWVWDFYVTHVTFTVNRAPVPIGFAYQGVPGGSLGTEDRLVSSDGTAQGARNSFNADLPGPVEWAYLADTTLGRSLFTMQHDDDALAERYQVRDSDTSLLIFGNGQLSALPLRFSLGIIPSVDHDAVTERVEFIAGAIR